MQRRLRGIVGVNVSTNIKSNESEEEHVGICLAKLGNMFPDEYSNGLIGNVQTDKTLAAALEGCTE